MDRYYNHNIYQDMYGGNTQEQRVANAIRKHGLKIAKKMYSGIYSKRPELFVGRKDRNKTKDKKEQPPGLKAYWDCINGKKLLGITFSDAKKACTGIKIKPEEIKEIVEEINAEIIPTPEPALLPEPELSPAPIPSPAKDKMTMSQFIKFYRASNPSASINDAKCAFYRSIGKPYPGSMEKYCFKYNPV